VDRSFIVLTAVGRDRPGIVEGLSAAVAAGGGNIEESKAAVLGGEFAVIMLVSAGPGAEGLEAELSAYCESAGLSASSKRTERPARAEGRPFLVETVSIDTPGIVHSVTAVLRRQGANIEELETDTSGAPWTGAPLFRMRARITLGPGASLAALRAELEALQREKDLDISIKPLVAALPE
jgi:glycine cleavage system transcriptional repressor